MSGSMKRALGQWIVSLVPDVHPFASDLANARHQYPSLVVSGLQHDIKPLGCGTRVYSQRDQGTGQVTAKGTLHALTIRYRIMIASPSEASAHGQEIVESLMARLEAAILQRSMDPELIVLTDTGTDPPQYVPLEALVITGRSEVAPDISAEPFIYRAAMTLSLRRLIATEQPVEHVIEQIHLQRD